MNYTKKHYQRELNLSTTWGKFDDPENEERILSFLEGIQWIPSQTTINRAIAHLQLPRTDGRTAKDDARAVRAEAQRTYDAAARQADQMPLTRAELDEFQSLSFAELQRKYWGEDLKATDFFSIRYRRAVRELGFRIPEKPTPTEPEEDGGALELSAADYHQLPARTILQRLKDPRFKKAVTKLINAGLIGLLIAGVLR